MDKDVFTPIDSDVSDVRIIKQASNLGLGSKKSRTEIGYQIGDFSLNQGSYLTSEIDALTLLLSGNKGDLFTLLEKNNIDSDLLSHFCRCEANKEAYVSPYGEKQLSLKHSFDDSPLFRRTTIKDKSSGIERHYFRLCGGVSAFFYIVAHDPNFFKAISIAVERGLCTVHRIDLSVDISGDIMPLLSRSIKSGHIRSFGNSLRSYGLLNGISYNGINVNSNSKFFRKLEKDDDLRVDTMYCGNPKTSSCIVCFYNKAKEEWDKRKRLYRNSTRIEIRLFSPQKKASPYDSIISLLLLSACYNPKSCQEGQFIRQFFFNGLLFSHFMICNTKRKNQALISTRYWSNWYRDLYHVLMLGCEQLANKINVDFDIPFQNFVEIKSNPALLVTLISEKLKCRNFLQNDILLKQSEKRKQNYQSSNDASLSLLKSTRNTDSHLPVISLAATHLTETTHSLDLLGSSSPSSDEQNIKAKPKIKKGRPLGKLDSYKRHALSKNTRLGRPPKSKRKQSIEEKD